MSGVQRSTIVQKVVTQRIEKLFRISESLCRAINSLSKGITMTDEQQLEAFGNCDLSTYEAEVPNAGATPRNLRSQYENRDVLS